MTHNTREVHRFRIVRVPAPDKGWRVINKTTGVVYPANTRHFARYLRDRLECRLRLPLGMHGPTIDMYRTLRAEAPKAS